MKIAIPVDEKRKPWSRMYVYPLDVPLLFSYL